jgi:hypothetical protein
MTVPGHCAICGDSRVRLAGCDSGNFTVHCAQCQQCTHCYGDLAACHSLPPVLTDADRQAERNRLIEISAERAAMLKQIIDNPAASQQNRDEATRLLEAERRHLREMGADLEDS